MKTRHHYPILLIALLLGLMGFAEHAQADYTLGHYTRVEADNNTIKLAWTKTTGSQGTMSLQFRYRVRWRERLQHVERENDYRFEFHYQRVL